MNKRLKSSEAREGSVNKSLGLSAKCDIGAPMKHKCRGMMPHTTRGPTHVYIINRDHADKPASHTHGQRQRRNFAFRNGACLSSTGHLK